MLTDNVALVGVTVIAFEWLHSFLKKPILCSIDSKQVQRTFFCRFHENFPYLLASISSVIFIGGELIVASGNLNSIISSGDSDFKFSFSLNK